MIEPLDTQDEAQAPVPVGALHVPPRLARWEREVTAASQHRAVPESFIYGILSQETEGGEAPGYTPKGDPAGTGDWTARVGHWLKADGVRVVTDLPQGWHAPRDPKTHEPLPGPYAIPADGLGWGRGLCQHDYREALAFDWRSPAVNIDRCAALLRELMDQFPRNTRAVFASYNCGPKRVRDALVQFGDGAEDHFTTGQNYGADVLRRRAAFLQEPTRGSA